MVCLLFYYFLITERSHLDKSVEVPESENVNYVAEKGKVDIKARRCMKKKLNILSSSKEKVSPF